MEKKIRVVSNGFESVKIPGWNTKNDSLRKVAERLLANTACRTVRVKYFSGIDLVNDCFFNIDTGGFSGATFSE